MWFLGFFLGQKAKFWSKTKFWSKIEILSQKSKFWSKIKILGQNRNFGKNRNCGQKSKFWVNNQIFLSKIKILGQQSNFFCQKSKFWVNNQIFLSKIKILGQQSKFFVKNLNFASKIEILDKNRKRVEHCWYRIFLDKRTFTSSFPKHFCAANSADSRFVNCTNAQLFRCTTFMAAISPNW